MKEEIARRWIAALRNPEAKQGTNTLGYADGRRCCLGVQCDLAVEDEVIDAPSHVYNSKVLQYAGIAQVLPYEVMKWSGMSTSTGLLPFLDECGNELWLSELNDWGFTFSQIADLIECFWRVL